MKYGIFYGYWEKNWSGNYLPLIKRAADCGFDILAVSSGYLVEQSDAQLMELRNAAQYHGIELHAGFAPGSDRNIASSDTVVVERALAYYRKIFQTLAKLDIPYLGGSHYACSPYDLPRPIDKKKDWGRCVQNMAKVADMAADQGITLAMEVVCRYEGYLLNTAAEGVAFAKEIGRNNVRLMLDTFHMNIEEDSFASAIHTAGGYLAYLHTGECNRRVPGCGRIPWNEIGRALRDIGFHGPVTMEPFVVPGGSIGEDLGIWRDLSYGASDVELDRVAAQGLAFTKYVFEN